MFKFLAKPLNLLLACLVVILVSSFAASMVQNSAFSVKVDTVSFETANGELAGYLYVPRGVDSDNPAPAVVLTHGYLNNAEMQEVAAIELSKRGYVVLAFSMYDHGDSLWEDGTPAQFSFFNAAIYDAVQWIYEKDYVLKDSLGNGMIGVSGHSMGGFSATAAVIYDEYDFQVTGIRKIATMLSVGSDFRYIWIGDPLASMGPRSTGVVAAHYDQFFFDNVVDEFGAPVNVGSVRFKDFAADPVGLAFVGRTVEGESEAGVYYAVDGGQRVIFTPDETHPQNTWSLETGKDTIQFFETAFEFQLDAYGLDDLDSFGVTTGTTGQTWWLKEAFTLISLAALITMIFPLFALVSGLPVFNKAIGEANEAVAKTENSRDKKIIKIILVTLSTLVSAYYIRVFMDRSEELKLLSDITLYIVAASLFAILIIWMAAAIVKGINSENKTIDNIAVKFTLNASIVILIAMFYRWLLNNTDLFTTGAKWGAPSVNTIVYWAILSAGLILLITVISSFFFNHGQEVKNPYGVKTTPIQFGASILNALALVIGVLLVVAVTGWIFKVDFRIYTYAIQIFNWPQLMEAFRYIPAFFVFYFAAGVSVFVNTRGMKKGWLADIYAAFLLAGPIVVFLIYNYNTLYSTGVAAYPEFSLSAILTVGLVPTLAFAGIIMRRLALKTNNIWTGVFFTSIFFTIITLANTIIYQLAELG